ncbi:MAG: hypothetical protein L0Y38_00110 [Methylococcaceae bacterium]|nr:hypothetical protein [Methylococcaceae bacterium]MCI0732210.1 hypothetical protein [Methylococcaceae bacterium]
MKISVEIDATPLEVREFFGLPDVQSLQKDILDKIRDDMTRGATGLDAFNLMKPFFPAHLQSMESLQKAFWNAFPNVNINTREEESQDQEKPE